MKKISWIIVLCWAMIANLLYAGDPVFTASAPATVRMQQQFQYTIEGNTQGAVEFPSIPQFTLRAGPFSNFSTSTQYINGKLTTSTTASYTFILIANQEGEFTIPPATVRAKRDEYKTNAVTIKVVAADQAASQQAASGSQTPAESSQGDAEASAGNEVFLKIIPTKRNVYLGEQFVSELKIYTRVNTRPAANMKDIPYEGFYKQQLDPDQSASRERINGVEYLTQVLQRHVLIPQKTGKMEIGTFESEWTVPRKVQRRRPGSVFDEFFDDPFSDPFFDSYQNVPVKLETEPVTINVLPLPGNAPEGFTGAVGDFSMTAKLSTDQIKVNDALNLVITIKGTGNLNLLGEPEVSFPPDQDVYETVKKLNVSTGGNRLSGAVSFEYPIVARHAGQYRIAPVSFSWFDPVKKKYITSRTSEFTFTVEKGDAESAQGGVFIPGQGGEEVTSLGSDILDIRRQIPAFIPVGKNLASSTIYWMAYPLSVLVFLLLAILLRKYYKQKADIRLTRNRKASKIARRRLKLADRARKNEQTALFYEETEKAIWGYLSDKLGIELSELSREKVAGILVSKGMDEDAAQELFRIMDDCEFSRYAPSAEKSDPDILYRDAARLIRNLEQNITR
jgi:hypothetical protein